MTSKQYYDLVYNRFLDSDKVLNNVFVRNFYKIVTNCALHYASVHNTLPFRDDNIVHYPMVKESIFISKLYNYSSAYKTIVSDLMITPEIREAIRLIDLYIEEYHSDIKVPVNILQDEENFILPEKRVIELAKEMFKREKND